MAEIHKIISKEQLVKLLKPIMTLVKGKADKATTLAGYGITDATIAGKTITLGSDSVTAVTAEDLPAAATNEEIDAAIEAAFSSAV